MLKKKNYRIHQAIVLGTIFFLFLVGGALPAMGQEIYRIGAVLPITGAVAYFGGWQIHGQDLALADLEKQGWINGKKLSIIREDSEYEPRKAISAWKKLVSLDKVNVVLTGGSCEVRALAPLAEEAKVVVLYLGTSNEKIKKSGTYIFKIMGGQVTESLVGAKYAWDNLKAKRAAVIGLDTEYGTAAVRLFKHFFEKMGGKVVGTDSVRPGTRDFKSILVSFRNKNPDVIVFPTDYNAGASIVKQAKRLGITAKFIGGANMYSPAFLHTAGSDAEGVFAVGYQFDPSETGTDKMKAFTKKYQDAYKKFPNSISANSYDAVMMYAEAVKNGAKTSTEIRSYLRALEDYEGATGHIKFDKWSENMPTHRVVEVKDGKFQMAARFEKFTDADLEEWLK